MNHYFNRTNKSKPPATLSLTCSPSWFSTISRVRRSQRRAAQSAMAPQPTDSWSGSPTISIRSRRSEKLLSLKAKAKSDWRAVVGSDRSMTGSPKPQPLIISKAWSAKTGERKRVERDKAKVCFICLKILNH